MSHSHSKLIYMANQIATFFESQPEGERAHRVAAHLSDFWEPRMRNHLYAMIDGGEAQDLHPLVLRAVEEMRAEKAA
ncbi:formate dehydrogenase [Thioclava sp. BHET1]|nr:formate dehydrogenase [Thioclava sp. BHET1]